MKRMKCFSMMLVLALVVSLFRPCEVRAYQNVDDDYFDIFATVREYFEEVCADGEDLAAGAIGAWMGGGGWLTGILGASMLSKDVEYYHQPTKIFDKINNAYKDNSSSTSSPNCNYYYDGQLDNSTTNNYQVFEDHSDYSTNNYNYNWYNPITQTYNTTENFYYSNEYNTYYYQQTTNNYQYDYYYIDNSTHVTYYIVGTDTTTGEEDEYVYDIYYELPDGRNSYDLKKEDVWGTYFIYNVEKYESVAEDDGTTLGLWHFDGNTNDSSYWNNSAGVSGNLNYTDGVFDQGKISPADSSVKTVLYLDKADFDSSDPFTLEWIEYIPKYNSMYDGGSYYTFYDYGFYFPEYLSCYSCLSQNVFSYVALVFDGSSYNLFINGIKKDISSYVRSNYTPVSFDTYAGFNISDSSISWYPMFRTYNSIGSTSMICYQHYNTVIDEMRLSKGALYTADYVPSAEPFTTNSVLVIPKDAKDNTILLYSDYDITNYRIGGARPTYPSNGYTYVALEDDRVISVQQYQTNKWVEVEARMYKDGTTKSLIGFDMEQYKFSEPDSGETEDSTDDSTEDSGSDSSGSGSSGSDGEGIDRLLDGLEKMFDTVGTIVGDIVGMVSDLLSSFWDTLSLFTDFSSGFSEFMASVFVFIPSEIWALVGSGITFLILLAIIRFLRG